VAGGVTVAAALSPPAYLLLPRSRLPAAPRLGVARWAEVVTEPLASVRLRDAGGAQGVKGRRSSPSRWLPSGWFPPNAKARGDAGAEERSFVIQTPPTLGDATAGGRTHRRRHPLPLHRS